MRDTVPRRLKRFYRDKDSPQGENQKYTNDDEEKETFTDPKEDFSGKIPTMEYEDVSDKNYDAIKKVEQQTLEEKLALLEVEKFKGEKKRLPTNNDSDVLANNLFEQFKNNPDMEDVGNTANDIETNGKDNRRGRRGRRRERHDKKGQVEKENPIADTQGEAPNENIKDLFDNKEGESNEKIDKDEFDVDLKGDEGEAEGDDLKELEDFSIDEKDKKKKKKEN